jgi:hypothetical protein
LKKDIEMGILRKVPVGKATPWCARALTVGKRTPGEWRRVVAFKNLNDQCIRETYHSARPFDVVSNIPKHHYKTVVDAYSGYDQILLDEASVELTTFISDIGGRYQHLRAPQGFKGSGDAFNRQYDDVISDVERKGKVVDDAILWDETIEQSFFHVFDYLLLCARNGVTLKPKKFQFCAKEVDYCGYTVGWETYRPSDDTIAAIREFPMPDEPTITDIRSWFGLVNQLAPFIATTSLMDPFRELLKSKDLKGKAVYWDNELKKNI